MIILVCLLVAALLYQGWRDGRDTRLREEAWRLERAALLQRIQAPEVAVFQDAARERKPAEVVPYDDDAAFWQAKKGVNGDRA